MSNSLASGVTVALVFFVIGIVGGIAISLPGEARPLVIGPSEPMQGINITPYEDKDGNKQFEIHARHWDVNLVTGEKDLTLYDGDTLLWQTSLKDVQFRLLRYHPPKEELD